MANETYAAVRVDDEWRGPNSIRLRLFLTHRGRGTDAEAIIDCASAAVLARDLIDSRRRELAKGRGSRD